MINIPPDSCKNISFAVLICGNGNTFTVSTQSDMCIYANIIHKGKLVEQKK
jgi:hypothetical protein